MSSNEEYKCRGVLGQGTELAYFIKPNAETNIGYYIPKSQVRYMSKLPPNGDGTVEVKFVLPEWILDRNQCWELTED